MCRSRRELSNAYFLAKLGFDTAENEPCEVCPIPRNAAASESEPAKASQRSDRDGEDEGQHGELPVLHVALGHPAARVPAEVRRLLDPVEARAAFEGVRLQVAVLHELRVPRVRELRALDVERRVQELVRPAPRARQPSLITTAVI